MPHEFPAGLVYLGLFVIVINAASNVHKRIVRTEEPQNEARHR